MATNDQSFQFQIGEKILCYHGLMIYEAKCTGLSRTIDGTPLYQVHYKGWKNSYDEWVDYERILKINHKNMAKMAELKEMYSNVKKAKTPVKTAKKVNVKESKPQRGHTGRRLRSNTITSIKVEPDDNSNVDTTKKKINHSNKRVSVEKNRSNQIFIKEEPNAVTLNIDNDSIVPGNIKKVKRHNRSENAVNGAPLQKNLKRINSKKSQMNQVIDFIDLTKDEEEEKKEKPLVVNIIIKRGSAQPVINVQNDDEIDIE